VGEGVVQEMEDSRRESRRATGQLHNAMQVEINGGGGGEKD